MQTLNRIQPALPAHAVQTFRVVAPLVTHWRPVTCAQTGWCPGPAPCDQCARGWLMMIDETTPLGRAQAAYIRRQSGRTHTETPGGDLGTVFRFEGGQRCFQEHDEHKHVVRVERPERFLVTGGDWRGNPRRTPPREHVRAADWVEDFAGHQDRLAAAFERG